MKNEEQQEKVLSRPLRFGELIAGIIATLMAVGGLLYSTGAKIESLSIQVEECHRITDHQSRDIEDLQKNKAERAELDRLSDKIDTLTTKIDDLKNILLSGRKR